MPESKPVEATTIVQLTPVEVSFRERISHSLEAWFPWIVGGWCAGVLLCSLRPLIGWRMLRRLRKIGISAPSDEVLAALDRVSGRLGLRRAVQVLYSTLAKGPLVVGYFRPVVLLPVSLVTSIPVPLLEAILAHELAHIRRHDFIINLLQTLIETLFFYHPAIWWLSHRIRIEREHCCDDLVVKLFSNNAEYGRALIAVGQLQGRTASLALGATDGSLLARIRRIVGVTRDRQVRTFERWQAALLSLVSPGVVALMLAFNWTASAQVATEVSGDVNEEKAIAIETHQAVAAKLQPGTEENLKWGEPVNGLRAALVIRTSPDEPQAGHMPDLYLVVQNVSEAPIRLSDTAAAPNLRRLTLRKDGVTMFRLVAKEPTLGDVMLKPREVAFVLMFSPDFKGADGRTSGSVIAEGALKDTHQSLLADMQIERAPAGAWTGKLVTGESSGAEAAGQPQPKDEKAQALFIAWQHHARGNGNFPGGLVGRLGEKVKEFIRFNTGDASGDPYAKKMAPLVPRFDATRDWTSAEVIALMDDIAAVTPIPLETTLGQIEQQTFRTGAPLPPELANAPWGEAQPNGLRMAWLLEPRAEHYRLGTPLKSRILFHNTGKDTVVFRTRTWHQSGRHKARDANGADIKIVSLSWTTIGRLVPFRLAPGEFVEVTAAGIGVGANKNDEDWQGTRVGSWLEAKEGDDVTFTPDVVPLSDWNEAPPLDGEPGWWLDFINAHLAQDLPLPTEDDERTRLVYRAGMELFGTPLSAEEIAAFVSDRGPNALDSLAIRLAHRAGVTPFSGPLTSGPTIFRVLPADPDAANRPRTAHNPGRYTLGENIRLVVTRRPEGTRTVNEASIQFFSPDPTKPAPGGPHEIKLPDGYNTWAAAWERGASMLWVQQNGTVRSYDFTTPAQVKETTLEEPANLERVPKPILDALRAALDVPRAPKPATGAPATSK